MNGRGRNLPDSVWRHAVRTRVDGVWQQDEAMRQRDNFVGTLLVPEPQDWYSGPQQCRALAGLSLSVEGYPPHPPAVRRRSIAPERQRKIASKNPRISGAEARPGQAQAATVV